MKARKIALLIALLMFVGILAGCGNAEELKKAQTDLASAKSELEKAKSDLAAANKKITELEGQIGFDAGQFPKWFEEEGTWRTVQNDNPANNQKGGFITDASGAPSDEDLKEILHMASLAVTSGGKTDTYMVAVRDVAEQAAIIGTRYGTATSAGTVTVLVFSERLLRPEFRTDANEPTTVAFQPDRGYYDAGIVTGYLNIAAIAKGYGTHMFMSPALPGTNGFNEGGPGQDASKYLKGTTYVNGATGQTFSTENMKFICAVVIGTLDESVENGVTDHAFPDNWTIWKP